MRHHRSRAITGVAQLAVLLLVHSFVRAEPAALPAWTPWDVKTFQQVPQFEVIGEGKEGIREILFRGPAFKNEAGYTKVFAYHGIAKGPDGKPMTSGKGPGLVLIHGWAGQAMRGWVAHANKMGYHAIALSTNGLLGEGGGAAVDAAFRGPGDGYSGKGDAKGPSPFAEFADGDAATEPNHHRWMYHATANVMLAHSLLRSFPEVDAQKTGVWGISWGGYHTSIVAGVDDRFKIAVPQYGCGFLHENGAWAEGFKKMKQPARDHWIRTWDPSMYVGSTRATMLFFTGARDGYYPLDSLMKTSALVRSPKYFAVGHEFGHGHFWDQRAKSVWRFLDATLKGQGELPAVSSPVIADGKVTATVQNAGALNHAVLYFTTGPAKENSKRKWTAMPMTIESNGQAKKLTAQAVPAETTAYYVGLSDTPQTNTYHHLFTSEVVIVPEKKPYLLTIVGGEGGGSFEAGELVTIKASAIEGRRFARWAGDPTIAPLQTTATFTMPARHVTLVVETKP